MAAKNVGTLILEARTAKKLSQTALAGEVSGLSGSDVGKAERGEKELTQTQLKAIAKVLGVTQKSLLEAPKGGTSSAAKKTAAKTTAAKSSTAAKTSAAKKTTTAKKTTPAKTSASGASALTTTEKKLVEYYRSADSDSKKLATRILKGEKIEIGDVLPVLMNSGAISEDGLLGGILGKMQDLMK